MKIILKTTSHFKKTGKSYAEKTHFRKWDLNEARIIECDSFDDLIKKLRCEDPIPSFLKKQKSKIIIFQIFKKEDIFAKYTFFIEK